jgi:hypothetical protein
MDDETQFVITMTTLPNRNQNLRENVMSLLNQNYKNFEVHLNLPKTTQKNGQWCDTENGGPDVPLHEKLKIFWVEDVGPITNLVYTVKRTKNRIIVVNDDFVYHPDMVAEYNKNVKMFPDYALSFAGIYPVGVETGGELTDLTGVGCVQTPLRVGMFEAYKSTCYNPGWFDEEFFTNWHGKHYNDDLLIGSYLGYKGIHKYIIPWQGETVFRNRMLSFPLVKVLVNCLSGVEFQRRDEGGANVSYKKFYSSELGKYLQQ